MRTVGVDLAAEPVRTAVAVVSWGAGGATVDDLLLGGVAAALGLPHRGYKGGPNGAPLGEVVDALAAAAPWLALGKFETVCRRSDDALDAVIAALSARAAARGMATVPPRELEATARMEGWIAVPTGPLDDLRR